MSAKLVVLAGADAGQVFNLTEGSKVVIGRGDTANFRLTDATVSRTHCVIELAGGKAILRDSGSRSGTRVDGKTVTEHELANDEVIQIGGTKLRFEGAAAPKPVPQPEPEPPPSARSTS